MIHFEAVEIGYTKTLIHIHEVQLESGAIYALIGSNGSGKTTFLNSIIGKTKLIGGSIHLSNKDLNTISARELAKKVAYVESRFDGIEFLNVEEYLALGRTPYTDAFGRLNESDLVHIDHALKVLNLKDFAKRSTLKLSDGERQLSAIARALVQTTPIIILDEPTAFLDYGNRKKLIGILKKIAKEENKCILFSSHDLDLCLEENLNLLIVDQKSKNLVASKGELTKNEILELGFNF